MNKPLQTIPSYYYTDPDYYRIDKEKILYRTWQFVGHVSDIPMSKKFYMRSTMSVVTGPIGWQLAREPANALCVPTTPGVTAWMDHW